MRTWILSVLTGLCAARTASAAVIVLANYTPEDVTFTVTEPGEKARKHVLPAHHVAPITITGPADLKISAEGMGTTVRVDPYNAYVFIPDRATGVRLEGVSLPGQPPERDNRPELNPPPRDPVKIPVTLLVDDVEPRPDKLWQMEVRARFDEASKILEAQTGFRFEFAGYGTWESDPKGKDVGGQLATLEATVKVKAGSLAVGFTSRKLDEGTFGACRGLGSSHVLIREWRPKGEPERVEVLVRYLAISLGAIIGPDPGSAMRPKLGDGQALNARFVIRLDPLNVLALNLLADQRRAGISELTAVTALQRTRLLRVYSALLQASPGDPLAIEYVIALEKDLAKGLDPKNPDPIVKKDPSRPLDHTKRDEAVRAVIRAVTERARTNAGPAALTGDELTAALVRAAADAAMTIEEPERVSAFLLGIGIALDDVGSLRGSPLTAAAITGAETDAERTERLAVLGNPTLRNRRDLCRRFAAGCGAGELLTPTSAENSAISRLFFDQHRPAGASFPCLAAEFAGVAFARSLRENPALLKRIRDRFSAADLLPDVNGLRDGLDVDKFEDDFGGTTDDRFRAVLTEIRKRIKALPVNAIEP